MELEDYLEDLETMYSLFKLFKQYKKKKSEMKKGKKKNRLINKTRDIDGYFKSCFLKIKELDPGQFFIHTRMNLSGFQLLLSLVSPRLQKTSIRKPICPESRLSLTLLYLSQGCSFQSLAWSWKLGKETVRTIIYETSDTIWEVLSPIYVSEPNLGELEKICDDFWNMWNLPNCIGAIDGKHIALTRPPNSGSEFFNYKKFYSIVLMAACDAKYTFTYVDIGAYGSQHDGGIFQNSSFGKRLIGESLTIPIPKQLPNSNKILPRFFTADAAFPLHKNIMKPFPGVHLTKEKEVYNKRISRARRVIENAFGILVARWRILLTTLNILPENAEKIVLACISLHNFLRLNDECQNLYVPPHFVDWMDSDNNLQEGLWRQEVPNALNSILPSESRHVYARTSSTHIREQLCSFVNNEGKM